MQQRTSGERAKERPTQWQVSTLCLQQCRVLLVCRLHSRVLHRRFLPSLLCFFFFLFFFPFFFFFFFFPFFLFCRFGDCPRSCSVAFAFLLCCCCWGRFGSSLVAECADDFCSYGGGGLLTLRCAAVFVLCCCCFESVSPESLWGCFVHLCVGVVAH